ncbi:MAG: hypothetical protein SFW08_01475 [Gemmatimonadaceae bacterium]|nr:hypothetical protein [Gemmatimonadaceae bacterium]
MTVLAASELLRRTGRGLLGVDSSYEQMRIVLREFCRMTESPAGEYFCLEPDVDRMVACVGWGVDAPARRFLAQSSAYAFPKGVGAIGRAWESSGVLVIDDLENHPDYLRGREAFGASLQSLVALAVPGGPSGYLGIIAVYGRAPMTAEGRLAESAQLKGRVELLPVAVALVSGLLASNRLKARVPDSA